MRHHLSATLAVASIAAVGVAVPVAVSSAAKPAGTTVVLKNIAFNPKKVTIKKGGTVTWSWRDAPTPHNVTSTGKKKFKSSPTQMKGKYSVKFTKTGTYTYVCTIHPGMSGVVVVK